MNRPATVITLLAAWALIGATSWAAVPSLINYQGVLQDAAGEFLDGTYALTFAVYPSPGPVPAPLWTETHAGVVVTDGLFNVILGSVITIPANLFDGTERWLGIRVGTNPEISPRLRLTSVPWAFRALVADSALTVAGGGGGGGGGWNVVGDNVFSAVPGSVGIGTTTIRGKVSVRSETGTGIHSYAVDGTAIYGAGHDLGVYGSSALGVATGIGVKGLDNTSNNYGYLGSATAGAYGEHAATGNNGYLGGSDYGAYGKKASNGNYGVLGEAYSGIKGVATSAAHMGVYGLNLAGVGVYGYTGSGTGVQGVHSASANAGYLGRSDCGVYGQAGSASGVKGQSTTGYGVLGISTSGSGVYGAATTGYAGRFSGNVLVEDGRILTPVIEITGGADLSERFDVRPAAGREPQPGFLVCVDGDNPGALVVSNRAYDKRVAGVISGAGGVATGLLMGQRATAADGDTPVALTGRVYCWADASAGAIEPGDLLTTSQTPGHAMKAADASRSRGTIIGKAMTGLAAGQGLVLVLVGLQ